MATSLASSSQLGPCATAELALGRYATLAVEWWLGRDLGIGMVLPLPAELTAYVAYLFSAGGRTGDGVALQLGWQL